jgi:hypothetical protein
MENSLLLSEFAKEDGFDLNQYITSLFDNLSTLANYDDTEFEPAP